WVVTTAVHPPLIVNLHEMESPCIQYSLNNTITHTHRERERERERERWNLQRQCHLHRLGRKSKRHRF
ncbi:MAG: hypothetical protein K7J15_04945, partial [Candidatus Regiella insecticola]|nr:hypothetical protein [Candidatus Regiella insecticola]